MSSAGSSRCSIRQAPALWASAVSAVTGAVRRSSYRVRTTLSSSSSRVGSRSPSTPPTAAKSFSASSVRATCWASGRRSIPARRRAASEVALEPVECRVFAADDLCRFLVAHPAAALQLLRLTIRNFLTADRRRVDATALDASHRLAHFLVDRRRRSARSEPRHRSDPRRSSPASSCRRGSRWSEPSLCCATAGRRDGSAPISRSATLKVFEPTPVDGLSDTGGRCDTATRHGAAQPATTAAVLYPKDLRPDNG